MTADRIVLEDGLLYDRSVAPRLGHLSYPDEPLYVTVVGLGYVGTIAAACLSSVGHHVTGIDLNQRTVDRLRAFDPPVP